jgi:hypothetical protein
MASYSDEGFEELAKHFREALGIDDYLAPDPDDFLRRLKHRGYIKDYVVLPDHDLPDAEAKYDPAQRKIFLRAGTCAGVKQRVPHFCFTIFHEAAHALLRHQHERKRGLSALSRAEKRVDSIRKDENDADHLAAALMAPYHKAAFTPETTPNQIAQRFKLSQKAAEIRHAEFSRIYRRANNLKRPLPKGVADFLHEQRRRGYVVTSLPPEEIAAIQPAHIRFTGDACPNSECGQFTMVRNGTSLQCISCGARSGED